MTRWLLIEGTLVDHFRVMRPLGRGGMAEVYLARDTRLGRKVALKEIQPSMLDSSTQVSSTRPPDSLSVTV